jgi:hypothetical protein
MQTRPRRSHHRPTIRTARWRRLGLPSAAELPSSNPVKGRPRATTPAAMVQAAAIHVRRLKRRHPYGHGLWLSLFLSQVCLSHLWGAYGASQQLAGDAPSDSIRAVRTRNVVDQATRRGRPCCRRRAVAATDGNPRSSWRVDWRRPSWSDLGLKEISKATNRWLGKVIRNLQKQE